MKSWIFSMLLLRKYCKSCINRIDKIHVPRTRNLIHVQNDNKQSYFRPKNRILHVYGYIFIMLTIQLLQFLSLVIYLHLSTFLITTTLGIPLFSAHHTPLCCNMSLHLQWFEDVQRTRERNCNLCHLNP